MTTDTLTLTAFLLARIEEDEAVARELGADGTQVHTNLILDDEYPHLIIGAARVLAECAAKRAIVREFIHAGDVAELEQEGEQMSTALDFWQRESALGDALRAHASVYGDHPDFNPDWA